MPYEIYDSEDDDGYLDDDFIADEMDAVAVVPTLDPPSVKLSGEPPEKLQQHVPTSGELRQQEISAAQAALLAPSSQSQQFQDASSVSKDTSAETGNASSRAKTKQDRNGGSGALERDIYDFTDDGSDNDVQLISAVNVTKPTKRKCSNTVKKNKGIDGGSDFDDEAPQSRKRKDSSLMSKKRRKSGDIGASSEDDYNPAPKEKVGPGRKKSTRSNTKDEDLTEIPSKRPRSGRTTAKEVDYYIPPPPDSGDDLEEPKKRRRISGEPLERKPAEGATAFMVDLTRDDLVLPTQRKKEYDRISIETSVDDGSTVQLISDGAFVLESTIPDPSGLEPPAISHDGSHTLDQLADGVQPEVSSNLEGEAQVGRKKSKKLAADTTALENDHSFAVASEWRAAKGKKNIDYTGRKKSATSTDDSGFQSEGPLTEREPVKKLTKEKDKKKPARKKSKKAEEEPLVSAEAVVGEETEPISSNDVIAVSTVPITEKNGSNVEDLNFRQSTPQAPLRIKLNVKSANMEVDDEDEKFTAQPSRSTRRSRDRIVDSDSDEDKDEKAIEPSPPPPIQVEHKEEEELPKGKRCRKAKRKASKVMNEEGLLVDELPLEKGPAPAKRKKSKNVEIPEDKNTPVTATKKGKGRKKSKTAELEIEIGENVESEPPVTPPSALAEKERNTILHSSKTEPESMNGDYSQDEKPPKSENARSDTTPAPPSEDKKQRGLHSPIRSGKVPYRVGLSKRARIEPLLKIRKK